jgi:soluble lytic murein transglycosylase-like protein
MLGQLRCALSCLAVTTLLTCGEPMRPAPPAVPPISQAASAAKLQPAVVPPRAVVSPKVVAAVRYLQAPQSGLLEAEIEEVASAIVSNAKLRGFDANLVLALIHIESSGNNFALSPVGAMGLMQIMPTTGEELARTLGIRWTGPQILFNPVVNIRIGIAYLEQLTNHYEDMATALAAYNWGPGHIDSRIRRGVPLPMDYSGAVLAAYAPNHPAN